MMDDALTDWEARLTSYWGRVLFYIVVVIQGQNKMIPKNLQGNQKEPSESECFTHIKQRLHAKNLTQFEHLQTHGILCLHTFFLKIYSQCLSAHALLVGAPWLCLLKIEIFNQKLMHDTLHCSSSQDKSQDLWMWLYYPGMENWLMSCCACARQHVQRKSTCCPPWACYFEGINGWLLKLGQG